MSKKKWFVPLGRGMSLNKNLVTEMFMSNGKYLIKGSYGETYVVSEKNFKRAKKIVD